MFTYQNPLTGPGRNTGGQARRESKDSEKKEPKSAGTELTVSQTFERAIFEEASEEVDKSENLIINLNTNIIDEQDEEQDDNLQGKFWQKEEIEGGSLQESKEDKSQYQATNEDLTSNEVANLNTTSDGQSQGTTSQDENQEQDTNEGMLSQEQQSPKAALTRTIKIEEPDDQIQMINLNLSNSELDEADKPEEQD